MKPTCVAQEKKLPKMLNMQTEKHVLVINQIQF